MSSVTSESTTTWMLQSNQAQAGYVIAHLLNWLKRWYALL